MYFVFTSPIPPNIYHYSGLLTFLKALDQRKASPYCGCANYVEVGGVGVVDAIACAVAVVAAAADDVANDDYSPLYYGHQLSGKLPY